MTPKTYDPPKYDKETEQIGPLYPEEEKATSNWARLLIPFTYERLMKNFILNTYLMHSQSILKLESSRVTK